MNNILGQYIPKDSVIHRLDPRTKIIITFLLIIFIFYAKSFLDFAVMAAFVATGIALSRIGLLTYLKGLKVILMLLIFTVVLQMIFTQGTPIYFKWWIIKITYPGIVNSLVVASRLILIVFVTTIMTATTQPNLIANGLESIFSPLKKIGVPVSTFAMMMSIALRSVPILNNQFQKIMKAQQSRGINFNSGGLINRIKNILPLIIPMIIGAIQQGFDLSDSMIVRGFTDAEHRSQYRVLKFRRNDYLAALLFTITVVLVFVL